MQEGNISTEKTPAASRGARSTAARSEMTNGNTSPSTSTSLSETAGQWMSKENYDALLNRGSDLLNRANSASTGFVRSYPVQVAAGGLVVGFLLGAMLARRKA